MIEPVDRLAWPLRHIGANIARLRIEKKMTGDALGKAIGHVNGGAISLYESGRRVPGRDVLDRIAAALGTSREVLLRIYET